MAVLPAMSVTVLITRVLSKNENFVAFVIASPFALVYVARVTKPELSVAPEFGSRMTPPWWR